MWMMESVKKYHVKGLRRKGQGAGGDLDQADLTGLACRCHKVAGRGQHRILDVQTRHLARPVVAHQGDVDAPRTTADVEHDLARQILRADHARHLDRAAGGQEALAPDRLEHRNQAGGIMCVGHGDLM